MAQMFNPPHPGRIIADALPHLASVEDFKTKLGISQKQLDLLTNGEMPISAELSAKIVAYFGQETPDLWKRMSDEHYAWQASHA